MTGRPNGSITTASRRPASASAADGEKNFIRTCKDVPDDERLPSAAAPFPGGPGRQGLCLGRRIFAARFLPRVGAAGQPQGAGHHFQPGQQATDPAGRPGRASLGLLADGEGSRAASPPVRRQPPALAQRFVGPRHADGEDPPADRLRALRPLDQRQPRRPRPPRPGQRRLQPVARGRVRPGPRPAGTDLLQQGRGGHRRSEARQADDCCPRLAGAAALPPHGRRLVDALALRPHRARAAGRRRFPAAGGQSRSCSASWWAWTTSSTGGRRNRWTTAGSW